MPWNLDICQLFWRRDPIPSLPAAADFESRLKEALSQKNDGKYSSVAAVAVAAT